MRDLLATSCVFPPRRVETSLCSSTEDYPPSLHDRPSCVYCGTKYFPGQADNCKSCAAPLGRREVKAL